MSKYKTGDRFIIELGDKFTSENKTIWRVKGFNALTFDEMGLNRLYKVKEENKKKFKVGDVVIDRLEYCSGVILGFGRNDYGDEVAYVLWADGSCGQSEMGILLRTDNHYKEAEDLVDVVCNKDVQKENIREL